MKENCNICQHKNICKWVEDYERVSSEVNRVDFDKINSPIRTNTSCLTFQKQNQKQDGFFMNEYQNRRDRK